jgi:threonine aldolase
MRQSGVLAAPGLLALHKMPEKLVQDHKNARLLAEMLLERGGKHVKSGLLVLGKEVSTNMVYVRVSSKANAVVSELEKRGVLAGAEDDDTIRFVLHHEISQGDIEPAVEHFLDILENHIVKNVL